MYVYIYVFVLALCCPIPDYKGMICLGIYKKDPTLYSLISVHPLFSKCSKLYASLICVYVG